MMSRYRRTENSRCTNGISRLLRSFRGTTSRRARRHSQLPELLETRVLPAVITVTTAADSDLTATDGKVSLREAIHAANTNVSVDGSTAGSATEVDVIQFSPSLFNGGTGSATFVLTGGQLSISESVTIQGAGRHTTVIDGAGSSRLFLVTSTATNVTFNSLTLQNGNVVRPVGSIGSSEAFNGGAIRKNAAGTLTLNDTYVIGNSSTGSEAPGGAVFAQAATVIVNNSVFAANSTDGSGARGGAIYIGSGSLQVSDSIFVGNKTTALQAGGGAIYAESGDVEISGSRLTGNNTSGDTASGGAVQLVSGDLTLVNTELSLNFTMDKRSPGGAIAMGSGTASLDTVQVSENWTEANDSPGAGVYLNGGRLNMVRSSFYRNDGFATGATGALTANNGDVIISQSTFCFNVTWQQQSLGAAITIINGGTLLLSQSTVGRNFNADLISDQSPVAGGIYLSGSTAQIRNSIVAGNLSHGSPSDIGSLNQSTVTATYSLLGTNVGSGLAQSPTQFADPAGNQIGGSTQTTLLDPVLGLPGYYGGPTISMPPVFTSPAIDKGNNALLTDPTGISGDLSTDQRGIPLLPRIVTSRVDMGATEYFPLPDTQTVSSLTDEMDGNFTSGNLSLREALLRANAYPGPDTINFASNLNGKEILLQLGELEISDEVVISGNAANRITINAQQNSRIFSTSPMQFNVTFSGIILKQGAVAEDGQYPNDPMPGGAALRNRSTGTITLQNTALAGNSTSGRWSPGGAIHSVGGTLVIEDSSFTGNTTSGTASPGGAIHARDTIVTVERTTVESSSTFGSDSPGGAISFDGADHKLRVLSSTLNGNRTTGNNSPGGGISYSDSEGLGGLIIGNSTLSDNSTAGTGSTGGGVHHDSGVMLISQSTFSGNSTSGTAASGGGISIGAGASTAEQVLVTMSTLTLNTAAGLGGGISTAANVELRNTIVAANSATSGAADISVAGATVTSSYSLIGTNNGSGLLATGAFADASGNLIGGNSGASVIDPKLGPLQKIAGLTAVHVPLTGSPAIDHGSNNLAVDLVTQVAVDEPQPAMIADQRQGAFVRILDGDASGNTPAAVIDMGAAEFIGLRITSPSPNAFTMRPTFRWAAIEGVTSWNIHMNNETTGVARFHTGTTTTNTYVPNVDLPLGKYRVWVQPVFADGRIANWSAPETVYIRPQAEWTAMNRTRLESRLKVEWKPLPGAVSYNLWADNNSTGQKKIVYQSVSGTSWTSPTDLEMGVYRFWIQPVDKIGTTGLWSVLYESLLVTTVNVLTPSPSTFSPNPIFSWKPVAGAVAYELTLKNASTGAVILNAERIGATSYALSQPLASGPYTWTVWAVSKPEAGSIRSGYSTTNPLYIGGRSTLYVDADGAAGGLTRFTWDNVDNAVSYNLFVSQLTPVSRNVIDLKGLTTTQHDVTSRLAAGTYRGWIQAVTANGTAGPWSEVLNFTIAQADEPLLPDTSLIDPLLPELLIDDRHEFGREAAAPILVEIHNTAVPVQRQNDPLVSLSDIATDASDQEPTEFASDELLLSEALLMLLDDEVI